MTTPTTKAPLEGEITLDSLNPPHGKITGSIDLPATTPGPDLGTILAGLIGLIEISPAASGQVVRPNEIAVVTYNTTPPATAHFGPGQTIPVGHPTYVFASGFKIRIKKP